MAAKEIGELIEKYDFVELNILQTDFFFAIK